MKDKKNLLMLLPILVFVVSFAVIRSLDTKSYAASDTPWNLSLPEGMIYNYLGEKEGHNLYSHYIISDNNGWTSGTKKIASKDLVSGYYLKFPVYCAEHGKSMSTNDHYRFSLNSSQLTVVGDTTKIKLNKLMQYAYPYIILGENSSTEKSLKYHLKSNIGLGANYDALKFDNLTAQEATTAVQAAIWNIIENRNTYKYSYYKDYESGFNTCEEYRYGKILTSEEEKWYQEDGCSSSGRFYKYVFQSSNNSESGARINALIDWYITTLQNAVTDESDYFKVSGSPSFSNITDTSYTVTVSFDTNMSNYTVNFSDINGDLSTRATITNTGNTYTISNVPKTTKSIKVEAIPGEVSNNVVWYTGEGQDFIGVEISTKSSITTEINYETQPSSLVLYKVTGADKGVKVIYDVVENQCGGANQPACLSGAKFALYYGNKNYLKQTFIIENGKFAINNLPSGTYYLKEIDPPKGYDFYTYGATQNDNPDNDGYIKVEISEGKTATVVINNEKTNICIKKVANGSSTVLSGAYLVITDVDGVVWQEFTSNSEKGVECFTGDEALQVGTYFVQETSAPAGFILPSKRFAFTVGKYTNYLAPTLENNGFTATKVNATGNVVTIENKKGAVISKSDVTNGVCVKGAELVVRNSNGEVVKDKNGKEIGRWISTCKSVDENGIEYGEDSYTLELSEGSYTLTETMTEELREQGYSSESETIAFTVDANGNVSSDLDMKDAPIKVCIYKVSKDSRTPLDGAEFDLYKEDGTLYKSITSSSVKDNNCISRIPFGTYTIKEIKAPNGYSISDKEITIEVKDTKEKQEFYIENEVIAPKTAMDSTSILITIASVFMVFGIGLVGYYGFKKQN